jgi:hypothetical protein
MTAQRETGRRESTYALSALRPFETIAIFSAVTALDTKQTNGAVCQRSARRNSGRSLTARRNGRIRVIETDFTRSGDAYFGLA